tara:strand:- start:749 stop:1093 length:345 start_codon:yes stop_codon:yes gene_type:complete
MKCTDILKLENAAYTLLDTVQLELEEEAKLKIFQNYLDLAREHKDDFPDTVTQYFVANSYNIGQRCARQARIDKSKLRVAEVWLSLAITLNKCYSSGSDYKGIALPGIEIHSSA